MPLLSACSRPSGRKQAGPVRVEAGRVVEALGPAAPPFHPHGGAGTGAPGPSRPGDAAPLYLALEARDFAAQAMAAWDLSLRGKAFVVVDQDPDNHKTHALACSVAALGLGIRPGLPYAAVRRRWRQVPALFRRPDWEAALREELGALCYRYTPEYEVRDDGSALLDLTGTPALREAMALEGSPTAACSLLARRLRDEALFQTGLTDLAAGIASTRLMARVMARQGDPGALLVCPPGREADLLAPLPPSALPGLSPQCRERIRRYALDTVGRIRALGRQALAAHFGNEGDKLYTLSCGLDLLHVAPRRRGLTAETVLEEDLNDDDALARKVRLTADKLAFRLQRDRAVASRLTVAIRYSDHKATRKTLKVSPPTDAFKELADLAQRAFTDLYTRRVALKAIALTVARPEVEKGQVDLFEGDTDRRQRALDEALTRIRKRSGFTVIGSAGR